MDLEEELSSPSNSGLVAGQRSDSQVTAREAETTHRGKKGGAGQGSTVAGGSPCPHSTGLPTQPTSKEVEHAKDVFEVLFEEKPCLGTGLKNLKMG